MNAVGIDVSKGKSMVAALRPMGEVALLRSPLWGAAFLAFCWIAIANRFIGDDVL